MTADPEFTYVVLQQLDELGEIIHKPIAGAHGFWERGNMFALISNGKTLYFKVNDETRQRYEAAGSERYKSMPFWSVPADVLKDPDEFRAWAAEAIAVGHASAARAKVKPGRVRIQH
jgi:DNA transformation protein